MSILQCGVEKSGNYWVHRITKEILSEAGIETKSYIQSHPIYPALKDLDLDITDIADVDCIDVQDDRCFVVVRQTFREAIPDLREYVRSNSIVWTHSPWKSQQSEKVLNEFNKKVYIIRDPRDAFISLSHFAFTPYRILNDRVRFKDPEEWRDKNLDSFLNRWKIHVEGYLSRKEEYDLYPVFYERFLRHLSEELHCLVQYLEIDLSENALAGICERVSAKSLKKNAPHHVRKAQACQWVDVLSERQKRRAWDLIGPTLLQLGYTESGSLECLPKLGRDLEVVKPQDGGRSVRRLLKRTLHKMKGLD